MQFCQWILGPTPNIGLQLNYLEDLSKQFTCLWETRVEIFSVLYLELASVNYGACAQKSQEKYKFILIFPFPSYRSKIAKVCIFN